MNDSERSPRSGRHRATIRALLATVAVIALGLAGFRRYVEPWMVLRQTHPQMAPVAALFERNPSRFRCDSCHAQAAPPSEVQLMAILAKSPHGPGQMLDCKSCHAR